MRILQGHRGPVRSVVYSPDGRYLASGAEDNTVRVWHLETECQVLCLRHPGGYARSVAFEEDGRRLVAASSQQDRRWIWNLVFLPGGQKILTTATPRVETQGWIVPLSWIPQSFLSAATPLVETVAAVGRLLLTSTGERSNSIPLPSDCGEPLAFSADARLHAVTGPPSTVRIFDTTSGRELAAYDWGIGPIYAVAFAPDGMTAAAAGRDFRIVVWDLEI